MYLSEIATANDTKVWRSFHEKTAFASQYESEWVFKGGKFISGIFKVDDEHKLTVSFHLDGTPHLIGIIDDAASRHGECIFCANGKKISMWYEHGNLFDSFEIVDEQERVVRRLKGDYPMVPNKYLNREQIELEFEQLKATTNSVLVPRS